MHGDQSEGGILMDSVTNSSGLSHNQWTFAWSTANFCIETNQSLKCPICGNDAGKHTHCGGKGCISCRAFFRRSVQVIDTKLPLTNG